VRRGHLPQRSEWATSPVRLKRNSQQKAKKKHTFVCLAVGVVGLARKISTMQAVKQEKVAEENDEYPVVPLQVDAETIEKLRQTLVDQKAPMAKRMRAVFTLRNINNDAAVDAMRESTHPLFLLEF
jgi:hypothetical protein